MSTTNGTRSLQVVRNASNLFTMAFINRKAVAERLLNNDTKNLCILGSGWEGSYSLEDSLAAGALVESLIANNGNSLKIQNRKMVLVK